MIRKTATLTCLFLITAATSFAQVKLEHKYPEGKTFTTETIIALDQTLTIAGNATETNVETITTTESTVGKRDADGKLPVSVSTKGLQIMIGGTAGEYRFDSANPDDKGDSQLEMMRPLHKALANRTHKVLHGKDNRVVEIKFDNDQLQGVPDSVKALVKKEIDPEHLKEVANEQLDIFPTEAVKKGDTWERTSNADLGAGQVMEFESKYAYEGTVEKNGRTLDKVTAKATGVKFSIGDDSPLPLKVKASELKIKESSSYILFDRERGRIIESKDTTRVVGGITFSVNGMELPSELDLTFRTESELK